MQLRGAGSLLGFPVSWQMWHDFTYFAMLCFNWGKKKFSLYSNVHKHHVQFAASQHRNISAVPPEKCLHSQSSNRGHPLVYEQVMNQVPQGYILDFVNLQHLISQKYQPFGWITCSPSTSLSLSPNPDRWGADSLQLCPCVRSKAGKILGKTRLISSNPSVTNSLKTSRTGRPVEHHPTRLQAKTIATPSAFNSERTTTGTMPCSNWHSTSIKTTWCCEKWRHPPLPQNSRETALPLLLTATWTVITPASSPVSCRIFSNSVFSACWSFSSLRLFSLSVCLHVITHSKGAFGIQMFRCVMVTMSTTMWCLLFQQS